MCSCLYCLNIMSFKGFSTVSSCFFSMLIIYSPALYLYTPVSMSCESISTAVVNMVMSYEEPLYRLAIYSIFLAQWTISYPMRDLSDLPTFMGVCIYQAIMWTTFSGWITTKYPIAYKLCITWLWRMHCQNAREGVVFKLSWALAVLCVPTFVMES